MRLVNAKIAALNTWCVGRETDASINFGTLPTDFQRQYQMLFLIHLYIA